MLFCDRLAFEKWSPDFSSSEQASPIWTRALSGNTELCNSLEYADWNQKPVQVQVCDACGTVGCASGGYVHISTIEDWVFWTIPQTCSAGEEVRERFFPATALVKFGAVAFPREAWAQFRAAEPDVPDARCFPRANGRALLDAWAIGPGRPQAPDRLLPMLRARLLAADNLETTEAMQWIEYWLDWLGARADFPIDGAIVDPHRAQATIETMYFDGPREDDWPGLARFGERFVPVLDRTHIFVPAV